MTLAVRDAMKERAEGRKWFENLTDQQRWDLGDALVLGTFDYRDWGLERQPTSAFMGEVDYRRMLWECTR